MRRMFLTLVPVLLLSFGSAAFAADPAAKPDCTDKQKALDDANAGVKALAKPDLSSCKDKKGKDKTDCEKPLKDKAKDDATAAKEKVKGTKKDLGCCKDPKKKGCAA